MTNQTDVINDAMTRIASQGLLMNKVQVTHGDLNLVLSFERSSTWDSQTQKSVPNKFITTWVHEGWPTYDVARKMVRSGEWSQIIGKALGIDPMLVHYGFNHNQFDIRPF